MTARSICSFPVAGFYIYQTAVFVILLYIILQVVNKSILSHKL